MMRRPTNQLAVAAILAVAIGCATTDRTWQAFRDDAEPIGSATLICKGESAGVGDNPTYGGLAGVGQIIAASQARNEAYEGCMARLGWSEEQPVAPVALAHKKVEPIAPWMTEVDERHERVTAEWNDNIVAPIPGAVNFAPQLQTVTICVTRAQRHAEGVSERQTDDALREFDNLVGTPLAYTLPWHSKRRRVDGLEAMLSEYRGCLAEYGWSFLPPTVESDE